MHDRLRELRTELGLTQEVMAAKYGIPPESWKKYELGKTVPGAQVIASLVRGGVEGNWLLTGEGPMLRGGEGSVGDRVLGSVIGARRAIDRAAMLAEEPGFLHGSHPTPTQMETDGQAEVLWLHLYDSVQVSAGNGAIVWDEAPSSALAFRRDWILTELRADPAHLVLVRVRGESMTPLLHDGDVVMLDRSVQSVERDALYVFRLDGAVMLKWLQRVGGGAVRVSSENRDRYPPFEISVEAAAHDGFQVLGLVRWWAHRAA